MVPHVLQLSQAMVHHPKAPSTVKLRKSGKLFDYFAVIFTLCLIIEYGGTYTKQSTGLPKAHTKIFTGIAYKLTLLGRP